MCALCIVLSALYRNHGQCKLDDKNNAEQRENVKARLPTGAEINGEEVAKKRGYKMCHGCRKYVKHNSNTCPTTSSERAAAREAVELARS